VTRKNNGGRKVAQFSEETFKKAISLYRLIGDEEHTKNLDELSRIFPGAAPVYLSVELISMKMIAVDMAGYMALKQDFDKRKELMECLQYVVKKEFEKIDRGLYEIVRERMRDYATVVQRSLHQQENAYALHVGLYFEQVVKSRSEDPEGPDKELSEAAGRIFAETMLEAEKNY
jgi:hypothetical protein